MIKDHSSVRGGGGGGVERERMTTVTLSLLATLKFPLLQCPYTFPSRAFCSILNRRILQGADSALILVLVVKALGIEETVGYN